MALIITRYYVLLQKFLLCRTPGSSMANWEHEEGVSQRLAERTSVVYARCLALRGHVRMFLWRKADVVFALCAVLLMWVFQFRVLLMWIPRYFAVSVVWRLWLCMV